MKLAGGEDAGLFQKAIEDKRIEQFVRDAIFGAWTYLVLTGRLARDQARAYLADFPARVQPDKGDHVWVGWIDTVANLGFEDLTGVVEKVFADGNIVGTPFGFRLIAPIDLESFRQKLRETLSDAEAWKQDREFQPFKDTVAELSTWYGYSEKYRREKHRSPSLPPSFVSAVNTHRDVGRNDPCPCGSGKKYKKCCLQAA